MRDEVVRYDRDILESPRRLTMKFLRLGTMGGMGAGTIVGWVVVFRGIAHRWNPRVMVEGMGIFLFCGLFSLLAWVVCDIAEAIYRISPPQWGVGPSPPPRELTQKECDELMGVSHDR